jgi:hypothetical protein
MRCGALLESLVDEYPRVLHGTSVQSIVAGGPGPEERELSHDQVEAQGRSQEGLGDAERPDAARGDRHPAGQEGWALVPYEAVPMTRTITNNIGYAYLSLFKGSGDSS